MPKLARPLTLMEKINALQNLQEGKYKLPKQKVLPNDPLLVEEMNKLSLMQKGTSPYRSVGEMPHSYMQIPVAKTKELDKTIAEVTPRSGYGTGKKKQSDSARIVPDSITIPQKTSAYPAPKDILPAQPPVPIYQGVAPTDNQIIGVQYKPEVNVQKSDLMHTTMTVAKTNHTEQPPDPMTSLPELAANPDLTAPSTKEPDPISDPTTPALTKNPAPALQPKHKPPVRPLDIAGVQALLAGSENDLRTTLTALLRTAEKEKYPLVDINTLLNGDYSNG